ncbi:MAG: hypothetical protein K8F34_11705 [Candidatus Kuenenia stuttgartiensis]|uniref:Lipoprotein n=1 Tax=Kuenenia stuttgartiensis TaxID=174633 RepID=Q1Q4H4_KUEST|nr:hypothetical protein [Candidatus Kuenenia stuttgartiensis]MBZ0192340.1 hypothetical protein [Candidatus Kuenenia stuttgartiensis]CAJ74919.1 hypothetical protein kuste4157 [Candidatus Kuenenia stuttgartiensis]
MHKLFIRLIILIGLSGCATAKFNYAPPRIDTIQNQIEINADFDVVWDRLVKNLSSDFFVINNIDKNSRLINVSFSTNTPSDYVDCGTSTREFSNARGKNKYIYNPADSSRFTTTNAGQLFNCIRTTRMNGRANIYISPTDTGTIVSVNAKYVIDVNVKSYDVYNNLVGNDNFAFDISTKTPMVLEDCQCVSRGIIEERILNYAKG